jgi:hypothetical protein
MELGDPIGHIPPRKPIDIRHPNRPRVITREQIEDNIHREPCHEAYKYDFSTQSFILRD